MHRSNHSTADSGSLPPAGGARLGADAEAVLKETAERLRDNFPYFHPLYAGQMLKPPHPVARLAYALAQRINPNNHALDGGRASSRMEKEAVAQIAGMFGWDEPGFLGHLCGGGTMANLEALWVAGRLHPGKTVLASSQAHYTHGRISGVLGLEFETVPCDRLGRMDAGALARRLERGDVGTVVATMGTTATGSVDPLPDILDAARAAGARVHADAAYGGYFTLAANLDPPARAAFARLSEADSIVVDPHKHGLQPYGCGCVLFRDPSVGRLYRHDSPYTYFTLGGPPPRRDQPRVLARRSVRGRALGDAAAAAADAGRRVRQRAVRRTGGRPRAPRAHRRGSAVRPGVSSRARHRRVASAREDGARRVRALAAGVRRVGPPRPAPRGGSAAGGVLRAGGGGSRRATRTPSRACGPCS